MVRMPRDRGRSHDTRSLSILGFEKPGDGGSAPRPLPLLFLELCPAFSCQRVVLGAPVVLRGVPLRIHVAGTFEPLEGEKKRARVDPKHAFADLLDALCDAEAVHRLEAQ